jgi:hypothetical protein
VSKQVQPVGQEHPNENPRLLRSSNLTRLKHRLIITSLLNQGAPGQSAPPGTAASFRAAKAAKHRIERHCGLISGNPSLHIGACEFAKIPPWKNEGNPRHLTWEPRFLSRRPESRADQPRPKICPKFALGCDFRHLSTPFLGGPYQTMAQIQSP